jgi:hypothetical protein
MIGSNDMPQPRGAATATAAADTAGLSDEECLQRLQAAVANHTGTATSSHAAMPGPQADPSSETGELEEVAALIGRLAVPLDD